MSVHEKVSTDLMKLIELYPIDLSTKATKPSVEMKEGIASAFGNNGYRKFIENCVRHANEQLISQTIPENMVYYKIRMKVFMELLSFGRVAFVDSELTRNKTTQEKAKKVEQASNELIIKEK